MSTPPNLLAHLSAARAVLSRRPAALVTDVDGTISRIVDRPEVAAVDAGALNLLRRLTPRLDLVAAVSGRPVAQLLALLQVDGMVYVGNHGLEWWQSGQAMVVPEAEPYLAALAEAMQWLRQRLDMPGVLVEDKGASCTLHYRLAADPAAARQAILRAVADCPAAHGLRTAEGRMVVNLLPPIRADKGSAVERLVRLRGLRGVVYLGDDVTDLDAFRALRSLRDGEVCDALRVAVASPEAPADLLEEADYALEGVDAVVSFLRQIVDALDRPSTARGP